MPSKRFQIGVLGDFAGSPAPSLGERSFLGVDRDSLAAVLRRLRPRVELGLPFCRWLEVHAWQDFHPDGLAERIPALSKLLEARAEVAQPMAMHRLLKEAGVEVEPPAPAGEPQPPPDEEPERGAEQSGSDLLDSILEQAESSPPSRARRRRTADPELDSVIVQIAESSDSGVDFEVQDRWRDAIDRQIGNRVRAVLQHRAFRSLEATWLSLRELVLAGDTDKAVRIQILHLTLEDLLEEASQRELERLIYEERAGTPGAERLDLLIGDFRFGDDAAQLRALARLAELAERARVPLLVGADESLAALDREPSEAFEELRRSRGARRIGLCYPRVLLRLPYGPDTVPAESFAFDETPAGGEPEYVWGSPAAALGRAVVGALSVEGTLAALPRFAALEGLPFHVYRSGEETHSQHPVERVLTETAIKDLVGRGLLPLVGVVGTDQARIVSLRSLSGASLLEG